MPIKKLAAGFNPVILVILIAMMTTPELAVGENRFHMTKNSQGLVLPFKAVSIPLSDFVREYSRITSTPVASGGAWVEDLKGTVTLFLRHPLKQEELTEIFYRVIGDNGYAIIDAPANNGWIIVQTREARDLALPVYESASVPDSSRLVTAYRDLKYADANAVARTMRVIMPANSRIIPTTRSQIFMTDTASNIRKVNQAISKMDTEEGAKRQRDALSMYPSGSPRSCDEQRIEKLVIENLEIQDSNGGSKTQSIIKRGIKK